MKSAVPFVLALVLAASASAQTHRWHDLTPDSLRGREFYAVRVAYDGDRRVLFAVSEYPGGLYRSDDDGASWRLLRREVSRVAVHPDHPNLVWATGRSLYKSVDGGRTWTDVGPALRASNAPSTGFTRVEVSPHDTARVVVGASERGAEFAFSSDGGRSWRAHNYGFGSHHAEVNFAPSPRAPGRVYGHVDVSGVEPRYFSVVFEGWGASANARATSFIVRPEPERYVIDGDDVIYSDNYVSVDGGRSFQRSTMYFMGVSRSPSARVAYGVEPQAINDWVVTYDRGGTRLPLSGPMRDTNNGEGEVDPRDSTLFLARHSGIFAYARSGSVGVGVEPGDPVATALDVRAYPNPARGPVTVAVAGPAGAAVTASVYDALGRHVASLSPTALSAGLTRFEWSGARPGGQPLAPGGYVVRVSSADGRPIRSVLITRLP